MRRYLSLLAIPALLASGVAIAQSASDWEIGPVVRGRNYSPGMPGHLSAGRDGPQFTFPTGAREGSVHYVTLPVRSLAGAKELRLRYRIDAAPGTRFVAAENPKAQAAITLYFQRRGDNWSGRGRFEAYRWYAAPATMMPLSPGTHEIAVPLDRSWGAVMHTTARNDPAAFQEALDDAGRVGFVFGSAGGRGHGVYATGPARFTVLDFDIR
ncbi:hypothetical protein F7D01_04220 [Erythrobacter sp. 3-20A1M]|uniref:hypothetical protein n=1 Tax=Erythrobacter sp. 3-20A1M TaxID=2653850 RepID=UPI001BFC904F|nr:hypothetical protein [Erythrobacter sp. 3-20A1M]QWC56402.1 hypothetical protein F7D01_04220 [Erythrobacter sp. 3-20A1M]